MTVFCSSRAVVGNGPQVSPAGHCLSAGPGSLGLSAGLAVGVLGPGSWCQVVVGAGTGETGLSPLPIPQAWPAGALERTIDPAES